MERDRCTRDDMKLTQHRGDDWVWLDDRETHTPTLARICGYIDSIKAQSSQSMSGGKFTMRWCTLDII